MQSVLEGHGQWQRHCSMQPVALWWGAQCEHPLLGDPAVGRPIPQRAQTHQEQARLRPMTVRSTTQTAASCIAAKSKNQASASRATRWRTACLVTIFSSSVSVTFAAAAPRSTDDCALSFPGGPLFATKAEGLSTQA